MGAIRLPKKVCLICAVCYHGESLEEEALVHLQELYGPVWRQSDSMEFVHTHYYREEMGDKLRKMYAAFSLLIDPSELSTIKHATNKLEARWQNGGRRRVNLDPGYIEAAKLVLASTKNFSHRVYIGQGIYGDVQLVWQAGHFRANPWTYPDYQESAIKTFFEETRQAYWKKVNEDDH